MTSVYFYCCNEPGNLQEDVIQLAEGLRELGVPFYSNCDYWRESASSDAYLLTHDPHVSPDDCSVVVVSYTWVQWVRMGDFRQRRQPLPDGLFKQGRKYLTATIDNNDGYYTPAWEPAFRDFDVIFRTKFNRRAWHPSNMRPWAYGLTGRMFHPAAGGPPERRACLVNFGASHPFAYSTRALSRQRLEPRLTAVLPIDRTTDDLAAPPSDPYDRLMWEQTGGRYSRDYYRRLRASRAVACFCGDIIPGRPFRGAEKYLVGGGRARLRKAAWSILSRLSGSAPRAVGCDSFRFWESLAAGTAAINVDLDHYGVQFPVQPVSGVHYLGVNFDRIEDFIDTLLADPRLLDRVGAAGREWAVTHYTPKAAAARFLHSLGLAA